MASDSPQAIVIGSGSGGLTAAIGLANLGKGAILIEDHYVGGDCTNVGCIPSKLLLHHTLEGTMPPTEILQTVRDRRTALRDHETEDVTSGIDGVHFVRGRGRLIAPGRVEISKPDGSKETVEADNVIIATGSRPRPLAIPGLPEEMLLTNDNLFELKRPPIHLVIVGGGPIGVEMATAFSRMGTQVTIVEFAPRILGTMLPEAAEIVHRSLEAMGVRIQTAAKASAFSTTTGSSTGTLTIEPAGKGSVLQPVTGVDAVLVSVGRIPNSADLGLAELGVTTDDGGRIIIDEKGQTSVKGVWAIGDVTDRGGTTHAAGEWGRRVIRAIVTGPLPLPSIPPMPNAVFGAPESATIGEQPEEVPSDVRRITVDLSTIDRAYTDHVEAGIVIFDIRRLSGVILGATIVGPRAGEMIGTVSLAMKTGIRFHQWYGTVWPYPTYSYALSKAVDIYIAEALPSAPKDAGKWAKGRVSALLRRFS